MEGLHDSRWSSSLRWRSCPARHQGWAMTYERLAEVRALAESVRKQPGAWTSTEVLALAAGALEVCAAVDAERSRCAEQSARLLVTTEQAAVGQRIAAFVTAAVADATDAGR